MIFVPFLQMRGVFGGDETAGGVVRQHDVLSHPCGPRQIKNVGHVRSSPSGGHRRSMTTPPSIGNEQCLRCKPSTPNARIVEELRFRFVALRMQVNA